MGPARPQITSSGPQMTPPGPQKDFDPPRKDFGGPAIHLERTRDLGGPNCTNPGGQVTFPVLLRHNSTPLWNPTPRFRTSKGPQMTLRCPPKDLDRISGGRPEGLYENNHAEAARLIILVQNYRLPPSSSESLPVSLCRRRRIFQQMEFSESNSEFRVTVCLVGTWMTEKRFGY